MSMKNYENYLEILTSDIEKMFEHQKEHICCKVGCSHCCQRGNFPFSRLEFEYLLEGFKNLPFNLQQIVRENVVKIKKDKQNSYNCPFLINNSCSVYKHRGLICRTFGLLSRDYEGALTIPFCAEMGLNYSKYFDKEKRTISKELIEKYPSVRPPRIFNVNLNLLMTLDIVKELGLDFGEEKRLIDWFEDFA